jgi:hypothetical protein
MKQLPNMLGVNEVTKAHCFSASLIEMFREFGKPNENGKPGWPYI